MKKIANIIIVIAILCSIIGMIAITINKSKTVENFEFRQDSLIKQNDSLSSVIIKDSIEIVSLNEDVNKLDYKLKHVKAKEIPIIKYVDSSKKEVAYFTDSQLVNFYNKRYLKDTTPNSEILINKFPLKSAALDLVEFDGLKEISKLKDTVISLKDSVILKKDTIISKKDTIISNFKLIVTNKDVQIGDYKQELNGVKTENKKLKLMNKVAKTISAILIILLLIK